MSAIQTQDRETAGASAGASFGLSARAKRTTDQPIGFLIAKALANPGIISLAAGLVDYETLPVPECREVMAELLTDDAVGRARLNYGTTLGLPALRHELHRHLAHLDGVDPAALGATADQIIVTPGSQQILSLITDALVDPGDIVITAWPSYFVYTGVLITAGASVRCVDMDEGGIIPARLEQLLEWIEQAGELHRVKIVYVQSYHQNPTGVTLAAERRPELLRIVRRFSQRQRILLLEDAAYRELTFEGPPPPSIRSFDSEHRYVALLQTFSKPFSPGLRVGYGLLPADLIHKVVLMKDNLDFGTPNLSQHVMLKAMQTGLYDRHAAMLRGRYHDKAKCMLDALQENLGDFLPTRAHWTHPRGGLYVWLTLPPQVDTSMTGALFDRAVHEGVLYVPGSYCYGPDPERKAPANTLRLSYGTATLDHIRTGIKRLTAAIRAVV